MVFLASQGNKIIQKPPNMGPIEQFCTILINIFKQEVGRVKLSFDGHRPKSYIEEISLERPKNCSITWLNDP